MRGMSKTECRTKAIKFINCFSRLGVAMASHLTSHFNEARLFAEIENTILLGQQENGSIAGLQERSATANKSNSTDNQKQEAKDKKLSEFLHAYQIMQDYIDRLAKAVEQMEEGFRQRDGEEWREKLALRILGEDDIPQQEPGENIKAYRERLEKHLINEMLNPDGTIKGKYKNDPKYTDYAEWAQKQYHLKTARGYVRELENPNTTPERHDEILHELKQKGDTEAATYAIRESTHEETKHQIKAGDDINDDAKLQNVNDAALNDFLNLKT